MAKKLQVRESTMFTTIMLVLVAAVAISSWVRAHRIGKISYLEHLEDTAVTIDGTEYKFRDLAFYLAHQEMVIQEQARIYDFKHTSKYWNVHANGSFVRLEGRDQAMEMAVHDVIFYRMALEHEIRLTPQETEYMENQKMDFWNDLEEEGQARLGVSKEEIDEVFYHMALAQKQQEILADEEGVDYREYNADGSAYQKLLEEHTYEINESLWERLNFGKIVVE